jgi:hypothetical protein
MEEDVQIVMFVSVMPPEVGAVRERRFARRSTARLCLFAMP